jgi:hypothetical protein
VLAEVIDFVTQETKARLIYDSERLEGLVAENDEEMERITAFIEQAGARHPKLDYQRNTVYLRFCHADYHKGAALAELSRLIDVPREKIFAAGDHHNDISMLDGQFAAFPSCPANAIPEVKDAVCAAGGYVAQNEAALASMKLLSLPLMAVVDPTTFSASTQHPRQLAPASVRLTLPGKALVMWVKSSTKRKRKPEQRN